MSTTPPPLLNGLPRSVTIAGAARPLLALPPPGWHLPRSLPLPGTVARNLGDNRAVLWTRRSVVHHACAGFSPQTPGIAGDLWQLCAAAARRRWRGQFAMPRYAGLRGGFRRTWMLSFVSLDVVTSLIVYCVLPAQFVCFCAMVFHLPCILSGSMSFAGLDVVCLVGSPAH